MCASIVTECLYLTVAKLDDSVPVPTRHRYRWIGCPNTYYYTCVRQIRLGIHGLFHGTILESWALDSVCPHEHILLVANLQLSSNIFGHLSSVHWQIGLTGRMGKASKIINISGPTIGQTLVIHWSDNGSRPNYGS